LIKESNQRKSRKNDASPRKIATRTPLFFQPHAHGICLFDDLLVMKVLPCITFILNRRSIGDCITRKGILCPLSFMVLGDFQGKQAVNHPARLLCFKLAAWSIFILACSLHKR
jgi:hypothetical protein